MRHAIGEFHDTKLSMNRIFFSAFFPYAFAQRAKTTNNTTELHLFWPYQIRGGYTLIHIHFNSAIMKRNNETVKQITK